MRIYCFFIDRVELIALIIIKLNEFLSPTHNLSSHKFHVTSALLTNAIYNSSAEHASCVLCILSQYCFFRVCLHIWTSILVISSPYTYWPMSSLSCSKLSFPPIFLFICLIWCLCYLTSKHLHACSIQIVIVCFVVGDTTELQICQRLLFFICYNKAHNILTIPYHNAKLISTPSTVSCKHFTN
jgi:hypothetical protein